MLQMNIDLLSVIHFGTHFNEILFEYKTFFQENVFKNMFCAKLWPLHLPGARELTHCGLVMPNGILDMAL